MIKNFKVYFASVKMNFYSGLQYKGWPIMMLQVLICVISDPISLVLMFLRFGAIGEWSMERILLIYAFGITSLGLAELFCRGFDYFPRRIQNGNFDRFLLYPKSLYFLISGSVFHLHRSSRVISGVAVIIWLIIKQNVKINLIKIFVMIFALLGGFLMYSGIFILTSGIAFFTIKGLDWIYILTNASSQITRFPIDYIPKSLKAIFTFLMPLLVISYYPASYICSWGEPLSKAILALPAGAAFLYISTFVWRFGIRHYKSTGS